MFKHREEGDMYTAEDIAEQVSDLLKEMSPAERVSFLEDLQDEIDAMYDDALAETY
jgi:hypothetical protein